MLLNKLSSKSSLNEFDIFITPNKTEKNLIFNLILVFEYLLSYKNLLIFFTNIK
jgi:hypothetical protein